jgi:DNA polymerase-3 subunit gamma/tau
MGYPLARKYRPLTLSEVVGQTHIVQTLSNIIKSGKIYHAYLFTGPRGIGKTTVARILAKSLNCVKGPTPEPCNSCDVCVEINQGTSMNILEIDGASYTGVDDVREIRDNLQVLPTKGRYRMYIIDEVHMLSISAFNALLKILEEPPLHVIFVLATTEPHKLPSTVISRCLRFTFVPLSDDEIINHLKKIAKKEGIEIEDSALRLIAVESEGSMRDALSMLDQVSSFSEGVIKEEDVIKCFGILPESKILKIAELVIKGDESLLSEVRELYTKGIDIGKFCAHLLQVIRDALVLSLTDDRNIISGTPSYKERVKEFTKLVPGERLLRLFEILSSETERALRSPFTKSMLDVTFMKICALKERIQSGMEKEKEKESKNNSVHPFLKPLLKEYGGTLVNLEKKK